jgi:hypothetical protein
MTDGHVCGAIGGKDGWQRKEKHSEKTCPSVALSTTDATWIEPGRRRPTAWARARSCNPLKINRNVGETHHLHLLSYKQKHLRCAQNIIDAKAICFEFGKTSCTYRSCTYKMNYSIENFKHGNTIGQSVENRCESWTLALFDVSPNSGLTVLFRDFWSSLNYYVNHLSRKGKKKIANICTCNDHKELTLNSCDLSEDV